MNQFKTALFATLLACGAAQAQEAPLCVEKACLGMTLDEAKSLNFISPDMFAFKISGKGAMYGLDGNGQRIQYSEGGDVNAELIQQLQDSVKTICTLGTIGARTKDSQGRRVNLMFRAGLRDGKPAVILTDIAQILPRKQSDAELQSVADQAKAQYGAAFSPEWSREISRPDVAVYSDAFIGHALTLRLPHQDVRAQLLAQPGCKAP